MKALSQRPRPGGSRAVKKRPSIPQLGDGLLTAFAHDTTYANRSEPYSTTLTGFGVPVTLTTSNLDQLARSAQHDEAAVPISTPSVCSDEDIVLIGAHNRLVHSESSSQLSSQSSASQGDETPPTTLTYDDLSLSSDKEATLGSSPSTPNNSRKFFSSESISRPIRGSEDTVMRSQHRSLSTFSPPKLPSSLPPSEGIKTTPVCAVVDIVPASEEIPGTESLHGIVRGFLATEIKVKSVPLTPMRPEQPPALTRKASNYVQPFWEPQRIFDFYIKGAITPDKAKKRAKRCGYPDIIRFVDFAEALKKKNPSLHARDVTTKAANDGILTFLGQHIENPAATGQQDEHNTARQNFTLKLASYKAEDEDSERVKPLHVFVDMSNIHIGFCNSWKISQNIPTEHRVRAPAFNFKVLAQVMERNRAVKKKVLASSVASHVTSRMQWPQHFIDAEKQGYKMSILNRVQKISAIRVGRRRRIATKEPSVSSANMTTSGDESAEDPVRVGYETRNGEQGVDEILHLNMMNSILDDMREPGSMILATGDAAQAEFSDGFLEYATRALSQGWKLELVTWKSTISSSWMNPAFRSKHRDRFRIIYLDDFLEELNADLYPSLAYDHSPYEDASAITNQRHGI